MAIFKTILMISICVVFYFPSTIFCSPSLLTLPVPGPEALAFDIKGRGPYTGVSDGRVLKYDGSRIGFATTLIPLQIGKSKAICDGTHDIALAPICGRPLGLGFYYRTGELYIADAFLGLFVVGRNGGRATQLATSAGRVPFRFLDGLEVDQLTGTVYFTDASAIYGLSQINELISSGDATGRLLKYDSRTRKVTVLSISKDGTYLLSFRVCQPENSYWLKGPSANEAEIILNLKGNPDNIERTVRGDFWVA
ncbi:LOW QUALITY PROTEIN: hypothetical protein RJ639_026073, partial [Escallonia herrerae]